jgi:LacI family transcriptional regulator
MDQVLVENVESTAQLVGHLIKLGHRRIGLVAGVPGISTTEERIEGWRRAHIIAGLPQDEALVVYGYSRMDPARVAAEELMSLPNPPTGIAAANNTMTIGVLRGLEAHGFRVPDDIALVAFDDFEWADLFEPRLTVIAQPTADIAKQAMRLLLSRIADPSEQPRMVRIKPKFVHRHSCGCVDLPASSPQLRPRQSVQV